MNFKRDQLVSKGASTPIDKRTKEELCSLFVQTEGIVMVRNVAEEALALASLTLFLAMVAVWAEVLGVL